MREISYTKNFLKVGGALLLVFLNASNLYATCLNVLSEILSPSSSYSSKLDDPIDAAPARAPLGALNGAMTIAQQNSGVWGTPAASPSFDPGRKTLDPTDEDTDPETSLPIFRGSEVDQQLDNIENNQQKILGRGASATVFEFTLNSSVFAVKMVVGFLGVVDKAAKRAVIMDAKNALLIYQRADAALRKYILVPVGRLSCNADGAIGFVYPKGVTLKKYLENNPNLSKEQVLDLISQMYKGIAAVHSAGFYHNDVKPENFIVVMEDGVPVVKIADFGISRPPNEPYVGVSPIFAAEGRGWEHVAKRAMSNNLNDFYGMLASIDSLLSLHPKGTEFLNDLYFRSRVFVNALDAKAIGRVIDAKNQAELRASLIEALAQTVDSGLTGRAIFFIFANPELLRMSFADLAQELTKKIGSQGKEKLATAVKDLLKNLNDPNSKLAQRIETLIGNRSKFVDNLMNGAFFFATVKSAIDDFPILKGLFGGDGSDLTLFGWPTSDKPSEMNMSDFRLFLYFLGKALE